MIKRKRYVCNNMREDFGSTVCTVVGGSRLILRTLSLGQEERRKVPVAGVVDFEMENCIVDPMVSVQPSCRLQL